MPRDVEVKNPPSAMANDEKTIEYAERKSGNREGIHGCDRFPMIVQERHPALRLPRTPQRLPHPPEYGPLRDLKAEHSEFTLDSGRTPSTILCHHAEDQLPNF
jgi:hypothetical protein